jgi:hypothetical protein
LEQIEKIDGREPFTRDKQMEEEKSTERGK